jgi:surface antigen
MKFRFVAPFVGMAILAGCASDPAPGAGRGAPIVPTVAATQSFDDVDQAFMTEHFAKAMDNTMIGQTATWTNPSSGTVVRVSPTRTFQQENSTYCREFTQAIGDKDPAVRGTACRQSDGSWQIVG